MMKIILTIVFNLFISYAIYCQYFSIEWQACYGGTDLDLPDDILSFNTNYVIVGGTESDDGDVTINYGAEDGWVIMTDSVGTLKWGKSYGGSKGDEITKALETDDGNIFLIGETWSSDGTIDFNPFPNSENCWLMKIDTNGNLLWQKLFGGSGNELILDAANTSDGGIVFIGWTQSDDGDVSEYFGGWDTWIVKLDGLGQIEWDKTIGTTLGQEFGHSIIQTIDGGYLVGITANPIGEGNVTCVPHSSNPEGILFKLDPAGNEIWQNCYGGTNDDGIYIVRELPDGFLFGGCTWSNDGDLTGAGYHWDQADIWMAKIDFNGKSIWHKCFGGTRDERPHEIFLTEDNGFMIIGKTNSNDCDVNGNHSNGTFWHDIWVFKLTNIGVLEYQQCIGGIADEDLSFWAATQKGQYEYTIIGMTSWSPSFDVNCDCYNTFPDYWLLNILDTNVEIEEILKLDKIKIYPNPTYGSINILFPDSFSLKESSLLLMDIYKRIIFTVPCSDHQMMLDGSGLKPGIYFIRISSQSASIIRKLIIL